LAARHKALVPELIIVAFITGRLKTPIENLQLIESRTYNRPNPAIGQSPPPFVWPDELAILGRPRLFGKANRSCLSAPLLAVFEVLVCWLLNTRRFGAMISAWWPTPVALWEISRVIATR